MNRAEKIQEFLTNLVNENNLEIDLPYYFKDSTDLESFQSMHEVVEGNGGLDIEIIGYYQATEYLLKHDCSLKESFEIANEFGYDLKNLSSEILATLHASNKERDLFCSLEREIESFIQELNQAEEEN